MSIAFSTPTWNDAYSGFILHLKATRAKKTVQYYQVELKPLIAWAEGNSIPLEKFGKRHMDAYLVSRSEADLAQLTLHHDAVCAKALLRWCQKNDYIMVESDTKLRADPALCQAFGMAGCAEQSVVQDTLDACTDANVAQMRQAMN